MLVAPGLFLKFLSNFKLCFSYQVGSTDSIVGNVGRSMSMNYPSLWPFNMASGSIAASIQVNEQRSEQSCSRFTEPGQRKINHSITILRNLDNRILLILINVINYKIASTG